MKKVIVFFCLVVVASFVACSNEEEPIYYGPLNYPMSAYIEVIDEEGKNLLDADTEGNIRENGIKVLKGEKTYYVRDLDKYPWETKDIYIKDNILHLSHFFIGNTALKQLVEIDWGNDCKDTIELKREEDFWYFYLNGEKHIGKNPRWVTIVME